MIAVSQIATPVKPSPALFAAPLFKPQAEFSELERTAVRMTVGRDQTLFFEDDPARYGYKLVTGALRSCKLLADGRRHIADFILPGDLIGFDIDDTHRFTAEAVIDTMLLRYPRAAIERLIEQQATVALSLMRRLSGKLCDAQRQLLLLGRKTAAERLASFLIIMAERCGDPDRVSLPMTRLDIADHLGLTIETVSRGFSQLKSQKVIELKGSNIVLLRDRESLEDLAQAA